MATLTARARATGPTVSGFLGESVRDRQNAVRSGGRNFSV